jgi:hypothetical protein
METQTLEYAEKWREPVAAWAQKLKAGGFDEDFAPWYAMLDGVKVPIITGKPYIGLYTVRSRDKTSWRRVSFQKDPQGAIICFLDGKQIPQFAEPGDPENKSWDVLWNYACKNPVTQKAFAHLKETGRLPNESPAAAADRGNVVSIEAARDKVVPATDRADGSVVTTIHNQPPEADTFDTLQDRYDNLKRDADRFISQGAAKTKDEADQATDLAERLLKIGKKAEELYKVEYEPIDQTTKVLRLKWTLLRTKPDELKKELKARVVAPWLKAEEDRLKAERAAQVQAGANPDDLQSTRVRTGSGLGRRTSLQTTHKGKITDRVALLAYLTRGEEWPAALVEVLQTLANTYAKSQIQPVPPGLEYEEVQAAV